MIQRFERRLLIDDLARLQCEGAHRGYDVIAAAHAVVTGGLITVVDGTARAKNQT